MRRHFGVLVSVIVAVTAASSFAPADDEKSASATASGNTNAPSTQNAPNTPNTTDESNVAATDIDKMLAPIVGDGDATARRNAAMAVMTLGPDAVPALGKELATFRRNQATAVFAAIKLAKDSRRGQPDSDLMDALIELKKSDGPGVKTALSTVVILRALAKIGTTPAARLVVASSEDFAGAIRAEVTRIVHDMGDRAMPALIEGRKDPSADVRRFSHAMLESFGKKTDGDMVQTKSNQVLADVLRAFAQNHDLDAVPVILSFVNSDRAEVQTAAREAILRIGQDAVWKVREAYTNLTGKSPPDGASAREVDQELFAAYDRVRLREVYDLLDQGKKLEQDGKIDDAIQTYDKVLARQPMLDRRAEMAPAYAALAFSQEDAHPELARATFRKALRIDPEGPHAAQARAELAVLEGKDLEAHGIADAEPFRRALTLDPGNAKARAELDRLEAGSEEHRGQMQRWAAAGALLGVAIALIVLLSGKRRKLAASAT